MSNTVNRVEVRAISPDKFSTWNQFRTTAEEKLRHAPLPPRSSQGGLIIPVRRLDLNGVVTLLEEPDKGYLTDKELETVGRKVGSHSEYYMHPDTRRWGRTRSLNRIFTATDRYLIVSAPALCEVVSGNSLYAATLVETEDFGDEPLHITYYHDNSEKEAEAYGISVMSRSSDEDKFVSAYGSFIGIKGLLKLVAQKTGEVRAVPSKSPDEKQRARRDMDFVSREAHTLDQKLGELGVSEQKERDRLLQLHNGLAIVLTCQPNINLEDALRQLSSQFPEVRL